MCSQPFPDHHGDVTPSFVSELLHEALRAKGWTQADLAREAGLDSGTISDVMSGARWPRIATQGKIEQALGLANGALQRARTGDVAPAREDADDVLLDLPEEALAGLSELERDEVIAAARLAALSKAREIRSQA